MPTLSLLFFCPLGNENEKPASFADCINGIIVHTLEDSQFFHSCSLTLIPSGVESLFSLTDDPELSRISNNSCVIADVASIPLTVLYWIIALVVLWPAIPSGSPHEYPRSFNNSCTFFIVSVSSNDFSIVLSVSAYTDTFITFNIKAAAIITNTFFFI